MKKIHSVSLQWLSLLVKVCCLRELLCLSPIVTLVSFMGTYLFLFCHLWEPFVEGIIHQGLRFPYSIFLSREYLTKGRFFPSEQVFKTRNEPSILNFWTSLIILHCLTRSGPILYIFYTLRQIYKCILMWRVLEEVSNWRTKHTCNGLDLSEQDL